MQSIRNNALEARATQKILNNNNWSCMILAWTSSILVNIFMLILFWKINLVLNNTQCCSCLFISGRTVVYWGQYKQPQFPPKIDFSGPNYSYSVSCCVSCWLAQQDISCWTHWFHIITTKMFSLKQECSWEIILVLKLCAVWRLKVCILSIRKC